MESSNLSASIKTQLCVILTDISPASEKRKIWPLYVEEFLRALHKLHVDITIIGSRPVHKFGSKKNTHYFDRHVVVSIKELLASKSRRLEIKVVGRKNFSWTRIKAQACVVFGQQGIWPEFFNGWNLPGVITLDSFFRIVNEFKILPGRNFLFQGTTNRILRAASAALSRKASSVHVIDPSLNASCWRAHSDRFLMNGGKMLINHVLWRVVADETGKASHSYIKNQQGMLILDTDTIVLDSVNDHKMNAPDEWKRGLFYLQRRVSPYETYCDEEIELERLDWKELYWRVGRFLGVIDQKPTEGAIKNIKLDRKSVFLYRKAQSDLPASQSFIRQFGFSGKILDRSSLQMLMQTGSVPKDFSKPKPVASLECAQPVACRACVESCPEGAILKTTLISLPKLDQHACVGCGACVAACPAGTAFMVQEIPSANKARYFFPDLLAQPQLQNVPALLLNRRGEILGAAKILSVTEHMGGVKKTMQPNRVVEVESSNVHLWDGRSFKIVQSGVQDEFFESQLAEENIKRGWVVINGARRMAQLDVPISVALLRLGMRRFEDAFFCADKSCRMCEIRVDGKAALACDVELKEEMVIEMPDRAAQSKDGRLSPEPHDVRPLSEPHDVRLSCFCSKVSKKNIDELMVEGATRQEACHRLGFGQGVCRGRWCKQNVEYLMPQPHVASQDILSRAVPLSSREQPRPRFYGFSNTPWHDLWPIEIIGIHLKKSLCYK